MIREASNRDSVGQYVEAIRRQLPADALSESVDRAAAEIPGEGDPVGRVTAALPPADEAAPSSGGGQGGGVPYLSRTPAVSLIFIMAGALIFASGVRAFAALPGTNVT